MEGGMEELGAGVSRDPLVFGPFAHQEVAETSAGQVRAAIQMIPTLPTARKNPVILTTTTTMNRALHRHHPNIARRRNPLPPSLPLHHAVFAQLPIAQSCASLQPAPAQHHARRPARQSLQDVVLLAR